MYTSKAIVIQNGNGKKAIILYIVTDIGKRRKFNGSGRCGLYIHPLFPVEETIMSHNSLTRSRGKVVG
jgi:hypothetical protein